MGLLQAIILAAIGSILVTKTACDYSINFPTFDLNRDAGNFTMLNSTMSSNVLQVTLDASNLPANTSGRALLKRGFHLYRGNKTASFNSSFIFNIQPNKNGKRGEGLAFIITSYGYLPADSYGEWLGLFNASTNGSSRSKVLAVEFDTRKSPGTNDPDGNHVGINVNGINSVNLKSLDDITLTGNYSNKTGSNYDVQASIEYDGDTKKLDVFVAKQGDPMPANPVVSSIIDLSTILDEEAHFGFSASTGADTELNCVKSWNFTIDPVSLPIGNRVLVLTLPTCLTLAIVFVIGIIMLLKSRKSQKREDKKIYHELRKIPGSLLEFRYKDLKKATSNFSPAALLGSGSFGTVYKGILAKGKRVVAVKRMAKDAKRGKEEFIAEISVINRLRHKNLVPLLGWCHEKGELIMVYEYMPNRSLDKHIFNDDAAGEFLNWEQRYNIVSGVASALLYIHEECEQQVIHRDVKASNIMLDSEYNARLGDFGIARLIEHDRRSFTATGVVGTMGYIAPECFHTRRQTVESDVFSFGAVVLEVTCGRPPTFRTPESSDLIGWVWKLYGNDKLLEAADSRLTRFGSTDVNEEDIKLLLMLGLACSNPNPEVRPKMREINQILARTVPPPQVPPIRPPFVWSHMAPDTVSQQQI